ncbi:MAG: 3-oxoacyl-ACP synthase [Bacteroidaceae bacterium]|nr:3-oxoacyl-ACP synthase [Bacteroidaceae bacterium]
MITVLATNITSPLGMTTEQNYQMLKSGRSALKRYEGWCGVPEAFTASLFTDEQREALAVEGCSRFESLVVRSVREALTHAEVDVTDERTVFILSTTKGNVEMLPAEGSEGYLHPGETAAKIACQLGFTTQPITVCNACISGVSAQLLAHRLISEGRYDRAVVCGADCQSAFIVSGFVSFKALSPDECRPFDIERIGLNLGEAASTIILARTSVAAEGKREWQLVRGCTNNDAYHISAPSPQGDGTYAAIMATLHEGDRERLATVSVHGTATMFNDQMESKALQRAGLSEVPLSALKGYYGHTMGAAGVLESIITMRALDDGLILPSRGFEEIGVSGKVTISNQMQTTGKQSFLKIISGFGGCNGALLFTRTEGEGNEAPATPQTVLLAQTHSVRITPSALEIDGQPMETSAEGKALLTEIYKSRIGGYPKYYKMDMLSRLVFVATELLLQQEGKAPGNGQAEDGQVESGQAEEAVDRAVILFNRTSSIVADRQHQQTISDAEGFFPSPSVFVYTLPNIVTGEIAIKHGYKAETSLYILDHKDNHIMDSVVEASLLQSDTQSVLTGWVDCEDENKFEAEIRIITKNI